MSLKSTYRQSADNALSDISAIQTLLHNYPVVETTGNLLIGEDVDCSLSFMMSIFTLLGKTKEEVIDLFCDLLCGKNDGDSGFLDSVDTAVKWILMANIKKILTCLNPLIPDKLMYPENDVPNQNNGIEIDISEIDMFNMLGYCPTSKKNGSAYYFDGLISIYDQTERTSANKMWSSCDFNAYLWYIIHRSTSSDNERMLYWDNRANQSVLKRLKKDKKLRNNFFNFDGKSNVEDLHTTYQLINGDSESVKRHLIIRCEFEEKSSTSDKNNVLRVYINPWRYANRLVELPTTNKAIKLRARFNSTIFEFNYDYIFSLKLFNSKTLVAQILNAIFGVLESVNVGVSYKEEIIKRKVGEMVYKIMTNDDTNDTMEVRDCFKRFSNKEYEDILRDTNDKYTGKFSAVDDTNISGISPEMFVEGLNNIESAVTNEEQRDSVSRVFENIFKTKDIYEEEVKDGVDALKFNWGSSIIDKLIKETVTQIVLQVLSPKIAILFKINSTIMGNTDPENNEGTVLDAWNDFVENFENLLVDLVSEISGLILNWLLNYIMLEIRDIAQLFALQLLKEAINDYRELLKNIIKGCMASFGSSLLGNLLGLKRKYSNMQIDNVNYADIIPTALPKTKDSC